MNNELELIIMQLITNAGDARSMAMQAIREARNGNFKEADLLIENCIEKMSEAHTYQTKLIFSESNGNAVPISLLMIHAQDHVMNAMTVKDLAVEMVEMMRKQENEK